MSVVQDTKRLGSDSSVDPQPSSEDVRAAWITSLVIHVSILIILAMCTIILPGPGGLLLSATPKTVEPELIPESFRFDIEESEQVGALSASGVAESRAASLAVALNTELVVEEPHKTIVSPVPALESHTEILESPNLAEHVTLKGTASAGITGAAGAIDRITNEILLSLDEKPTLVVWLFDRSGSLQRQREEIVRRFDRVYEELGIIEAAGNEAFKRHKDKPLLTAVASFGRQLQIHTPQPTDNLNDIKAAVRGVTEDTSGIENVFTSIAQIARDFRFHRLKSPRRRVMIVVFSDEAGDDIDSLELAVTTCRKYEIPVYVVGVPAPFGREYSYVKYVDPDPDFDQRTQWVPVRQGPESLLPERLKLYFSNRGNREELIDSGFGPFGLTRLAYETGGVYFAVHPNRREGGRVRRRDTAVMSAYLATFFDPRIMRSYRPDYVSVDEYYRLLKANGARAALVEAAQLSWTESLNDPRTVFPKVDDAEFARDLTNAQRSAAELEPVLDELVFTLRKGENDREDLLQPRWQAGYDLAMGRALAVTVRAAGYNAMLAIAKQGLAFEQEKSDTWELVPSAEITSGSTLAKEAAAAESYLNRVVTEHAETPWAMLAEVELQTPLGWRWQERFTDVIARRQPQGNNRNRPPRDNTPRPPTKPLRKPPAL